MKIILISGKAQHGKDTTATYLRDQLVIEGYPEKRILITHYADLLKWVATNYFDWDGKKDTAGRSLLQTIGQNVREYMPDYWCNALWHVIKAFEREWDYIIVPDVRYPNEIAVPISFFGADKVRHWRVIRPDFDNGLTPEQKAHESETALDNTDASEYIYNSKTLYDLNATIAEIVKELVHNDYSNRPKPHINTLEE